MKEPGNISVFENEERADYISDHQTEENLDSEEDNYEYTDTIAYETVDEDEELPAESNKEEAIQKVIDYLTTTVEVYGADAKVTAEETSQAITFNIESDKAGLIIGKHGKIINALQTLAQTVYQQNERKRASVIVNVGDYRERREKILENIADRTAERVLRTKQPVFLEPLPAFERKQIHARLSKNDRLSTHSEGKEPHRYLVVEIAE